VAGVGQQRDGIAQHAIDHLENHEASIEGDPDGERLAETGGRVNMAVAALIVMSAMVVIVPGVIVIMAVAVLVRMRRETYSVTRGYG
jgi:NaMN:DMB phosphoribosyltransferase